MRAGGVIVLGAGLAAGPPWADAIVQITNTAKATVTVRIDGGFGCRAQSKTTAPPDMDLANQCSFGTDPAMSAQLRRSWRRLRRREGSRTTPPSLDPPAFAGTNSSSTEFAARLFRDMRAAGRRSSRSRSPWKE
jgi:hypothetical protein